MFAELLGKKVGYCKGKGGSMHIADPDTGNLGANAIVGGGAGIAPVRRLRRNIWVATRLPSVSLVRARSARVCFTKR
jgi:TPP-dependent pyruvate/acetoin dehydrogenase alpha subunit